MLVPDSGRDGAGVPPCASGGADDVPAGVAVSQIQFVEFKQLGFLQTPLDTQTMLFAQSALLVQLSPHERGTAGVGVGVVVGVAVGVAVAQIQSTSLVQLVVLH